jgi:hypothetical protein
MNKMDFVKFTTPKGDLSWYIKWGASIFIIIGMLMSSLNLFPYNLFLHLIGVSGWFVVGMLWHDRSLIVVNAIAVFIFLSGIIKHYYITIV